MYINNFCFWINLLCFISISELQNANLPTTSKTATCTTHYLKLRLDISDVYVIDTPEEFEKAISDISEVCLINFIQKLTMFKYFWII